MPVTIVATPGASNANSYGTQAEADAYFLARLPLSTPWSAATDPTAALVMATRVLESLATGHKRLVEEAGKQFYVTAPRWTGSVATDTQALSWPRKGMYDQLGRPIPEDAIPQRLKEAQFELAGQLVLADRTLDNEVSLAGLTSVRAGSVALTFKEQIARQVLPASVMELLVPSWLTDELVTSTTRLFFGAVPQDSSSI